MVQTVYHRNVTVFTLLKQLAVLTPFQAMRYFKPNESQAPISTASPNSPWQLLKFRPMAETTKISAWQFSPRWHRVHRSVHMQSLLLASEPGRKGFFLDQWTLLSRWKNLIGFLQNAANSYQSVSWFLLGTDLLLSQPYVIGSSRADHKTGQKITVFPIPADGIADPEERKFLEHLYNFSYNSNLIAQTH